MQSLKIQFCSYSLFFVEGWDGMGGRRGLGPVEIMRALSTQGRAGQADSGWQGELNREIDQDLRL